MANTRQYAYYLEGNEIMKGKTNVIVTDGFTGNIALKTAEGTAKFITDNLKLSLKENILAVEDDFIFLSETITSSKASTL